MALGTKDILKLKTYSRFQSLVEQITVRYTSQEHDDTRLEVNFYKIANTDQYMILNDGPAVSAIAGSPPKNDLARLPDNVLQQIFKLTTYSASGIAFGLDNQTMKGLNIGITQLDRGFYSYSTFWMAIARSNTITLKTSTVETTTDFKNFAGLQELSDLTMGTFSSPLYLILRECRTLSAPLLV